MALLLGCAVRALPGKRVALSAMALLLATNWLHAEAMIRADPAERLRSPTS